MSYRAVPIGNLGGGLVLRSQPDVLDPSQAVDLLNVQFSEAGAVRQRDGYALLSSTALTNQPDSIGVYEVAAGTKRLVVGNGVRLDVFTSFPGATAANNTGAFTQTASGHFFARFGGPTAELLFASNGTDQVCQLDGTTFTRPAGLSGQTGKFVAVWENRLVVARESGTTAGNNPSSVNFSDPADPTNFTAGVFEDLGPGDGEAIMGMCTWRELLLVWKSSRIYVFYGIGADEAGEADPAYRVIEMGVGLAASRALAVSRDGVFFLDRKGVYLCNGQTVEQVSGPIDPFFNGIPSIYFRSNVLNASSIGTAAMGFHEERLYLSVPTGTSSENDRMLVHDPRYGWWSLYDIPAAAMCVFRPSSTEELVFATTSTVGKHVARHANAYTADAMATDATGGTAITSRWRSGWLNFGDPNQKRVRERKLWGEGKYSLKATVDYRDEGISSLIDHGSSDTADWADAVWSDAVWHYAGQITPYLNRVATRGSVHSIEFSNSTLNQDWAVHSLSHNLPDFRPPSVTRTEQVAA